MKELVLFKFNQIGIVHNLTLDAVSQLPGFPNISNEEVYHMGIKIQNQLLGYTCNSLPYPDYGDIEPYYNLIKGEDAFIKVINELLKNGIMSKMLYNEMKLYYDDLITVDNYKELTETVSKFVKRFTANKKLTEVEKILCWGVASVTIFSYNYWSNVEFNPESPWYKVYHKRDGKSSVGSG